MESQIAFLNKYGRAYVVLGVDMASTGEVGCLGEDANHALLQSMLSVGQRIPKKSVLFTIGDAKNKVALQDAARQLVEKGYTLYATPGTKRFFDEIGVPVTLVYHPHDKDMQPQALDLMHAHEIDMVVSVPKAIVS